MNSASQSHFAPRSAQDCKTQWVGSDQPSLVKTSEWDLDDDERLQTLVGGRNVSQGEVDWVDIASSLGVCSVFPLYPSWILIRASTPFRALVRRSSA